MALFKAPVLDEKEHQVIQRITDLRATLSYLVGTSPRRWQGLLRRTAFARALKGSNSIEGYNVSVEDALAAAQGDQPVEASGDTWQAVVGYRNAMTCVMQVAEDSYFQISTDWIRSLHFMMIQHDLSKNPGRWRPGAIFVKNSETIVYEGPSPESVPPLMGELAEVLRTPGDTPALVQAAMGHLNLVMIHPFSDGNGRMGRCLQTLILARNGTSDPTFSSIEEYLGANTQDYYNVLAEVGAGAWHPERDTHPWIRFNLKAHYIQATTLLRRSREYSALWNVLEQEMHRLGLPDRLVAALVHAAMGFATRNATYRMSVDISDQLASRDLRGGVNAGLLTPHGERRGRRYTASAELLQFRESTRQPKKVSDPFTEPNDAELILPGFET